MCIRTVIRETGRRSFNFPLREDLSDVCRVTLSVCRYQTVGKIFPEACLNGSIQKYKNFVNIPEMSADKIGGFGIMHCVSLDLCGGL